VSETLTPLDAARKYIAAGLSVIPIMPNGTKAPALSKGEPQKYRERFATEEELVKWFSDGKFGVGIVCGPISGNLAVMDFETDKSWEQWLERMQAADLSSLLNTAPIIRTPKGGRHVYCRIAEGWVGGSKLARKKNKDTLVEVRGNGHYVLAPGSPPACHPKNVGYEFIAEGWLNNGQL